MIDCGSTWNPVSQLLMKESDGLPESGHVPSGLKTVDVTLLMIYGSHKINTRVADRDGIVSETNGDFLAVDITGRCEVILGLPWLRAAQPVINWLDGTFMFGGPLNLPRVYASEEVVGWIDKPTGWRWRWPSLTK